MGRTGLDPTLGSTREPEALAKLEHVQSSFQPEESQPDHFKDFLKFEASAAAGGLSSASTMRPTGTAFIREEIQSDTCPVSSSFLPYTSSALASRDAEQLPESHIPQQLWKTTDPTEKQPLSGDFSDSGIGLEPKSELRPTNVQAWTSEMYIPGYGRDGNIDPGLLPQSNARHEYNNQSAQVAPIYHAGNTSLSVDDLIREEAAIKRNSQSIEEGTPYMAPKPAFTKTGRISKAKKGVRGAHICSCGGVSHHIISHLLVSPTS
jgi:hypothetical protein